MSDKYFKCPYCDHKYTSKKVLYSHMENKHKSLLGGLSPAQAYFNYKNKKTCGRCIMCKKPTKFNEATEKYERLCSEKCKKAYREMFRKRMQEAGKDPDTFLNDAEQQNKMLAARRISGEYLWSDGKTKTKYVGSYEMDFLRFCDLFLNMSPTDIMSPAPQIFHYKIEGKDHFHIPDFYIQSLNLIVQIKSKTNKHYRERDIEKEKICDRLVEKDVRYNYIKIFDKNYDNFIDYIMKIKEN